MRNYKIKKDNLRSIKKVRIYFSSDHIQSAVHFANLAAMAENGIANNNSEEEAFSHSPGDHRAYVTGCIFAAVSFLEATINEVFSDTLDAPKSIFIKDLNDDTINIMAEMWKNYKIPRYSILEKYQIALTLAKKPLLISGNPPYQDIQFLIALRNEMIHYKPKWITTISNDDSEPLTIIDLQKRLQGKFPLNPFATKPMPFFPEKCLGHGCAKWAVDSSIKFVNEFYSKMGSSRNFDNYRKDLIK